MTHDEFVRQLEKAVISNDRWALSELNSKNKSHKLRKEAYRHADNLIIFDKDGDANNADMARIHLHGLLSRLQLEEALTYQQVDR